MQTTTRHGGKPTLTAEQEFEFWAFESRVIRDKCRSMSHSAAECPLKASRKRIADRLRACRVLARSR